MPSKQTQVSGTIKFGEETVKPTSRSYQNRLAYLSQYDTDLTASSTPRESIEFSARLRLPIQQHADKILQEMDLSSVADNFIGGSRIRGLSGGEKRRVSLALALVVQPTIILSNEVTSGLDTFNAVQVLKLLKKVARNGAAVVTSIHQPTSPMFETLDHVTLVRQGEIMFQGRPSDLRDYFENRSLPVPIQYSAADWMLEVSQSNTTEELRTKGFYKDFPGDLPVRPGAHVPSIDETASKSDRLSITGEVWELSSKREFRNLYRDKVVIAIRLGVLLGGSSLLCISMPGVAREEFDSIESFSTHVGAVFLALFVTFSPVLFILVEFPDKLRVFVNEFRMNYFRMSSYVIYSLLMELATMLLNVIIYLTPVYFGLGFQARFWNVFFIIFWYASCSAATALLIASTLPSPEHSTDIFPLTLRKCDQSTVYVMM